MAKYRAAIAHGTAEYPTVAPFDPTMPYPEYRGPVASSGGSPNHAYSMVRSALAALYPEGDRHGRGAQWNPLGYLIGPGQTVFVKPNLVDDKHRFGGDVWSVITHPSVVRAVVDYVALALRGQGRIVVGDNPHIDADWSEISRLYAADQMTSRVAESYGVEVDWIDGRSWHMPDLSQYGWRDGREELAGDPLGERTVRVTDSYLDSKAWWLFRGTYNERWETVRSHHRAHSYSFAGSIYDADTYVSVPKLKAHAKVGVTLNLKGLIGTITNKNALVHWSIGYPRFGGDEYPDPDSVADYPRLYWQHLVNDLVPSKVLRSLRSLGDSRVGKAYAQAVTTEAQRARLLRGAWDGNDTTWRMTADVHDAFVGGPRATAPRRTLSIVDGIIGGDTDGPHFPHRVQSGVVVGAESLLVADLVATRLMDFDVSAVRYLEALREAHHIELEHIGVVGGPPDFFAPDQRYLGFRPPNRWPELSIGHQEPAGDYLADRRSKECVA